MSLAVTIRSGPFAGLVVEVLGETQHHVLTTLEVQGKRRRCSIPTGDVYGRKPETQRGAA